MSVTFGANLNPMGLVLATFPMYRVYQFWESPTFLKNDTGLRNHESTQITFDIICFDLLLLHTL